MSVGVTVVHRSCGHNKAIVARLMAKKRINWYHEGSSTNYLFSKPSISFQCLSLAEPIKKPEGNYIQMTLFLRSISVLLSRTQKGEEWIWRSKWELLRKKEVYKILQVNNGDCI
jgi:hypothetical protein